MLNILETPGAMMVCPNSATLQVFKELCNPGPIGIGSTPPTPADVGITEFMHIILGASEDLMHFAPTPTPALH
jgi:hypothetical protein